MRRNNIFKEEFQKQFRLLFCVLLIGFVSLGVSAADNDVFVEEQQDAGFEWGGVNVLKLFTQDYFKIDSGKQDDFSARPGGAGEAIEPFTFQDNIYLDEENLDLPAIDGEAINQFDRLGVNSLGIGILPILEYGGSFIGQRAGVFATHQDRDTRAYLGHEDAAVIAISANDDTPALLAQGNALIDGLTVSQSLLANSLAVNGNSYLKRVYGVNAGNGYSAELMIYADKIRYDGNIGDGDADLVLEYRNRETGQESASWIMGRDDDASDNKGLWLVSGQGRGVYVRGGNYENGFDREAVLNVGGVIEFADAQHPNEDTTPVQLFKNERGDFVIRLG
ncbi:MAG: hypothetical protein H6502_00015 [Candidatus Woesearchaeota archaeon]|nr:MAG: hypothetical protein H6502_00015 [Candidatus Woesearchaeota archaeon]